MSGTSTVKVQDITRWCSQRCVDH